jgi:hypothetical protein
MPWIHADTMIINIPKVEAVDWFRSLGFSECNCLLLVEVLECVNSNYNGTELLSLVEDQA